jgi:hypothetical protein
LLLGLLDEVANGIASENLFGVKDLVEILLQLLSTLLDIFGTLIGDAKYLFLGKRRPR